MKMIFFYADVQQLKAISLLLQFQHFYSNIQHYYNKFGPNFTAKFDKQMNNREIKTHITFYLFGKRVNLLLMSSSSNDHASVGSHFVC
jgi:hypothetical protein